MTPNSIMSVDEMTAAAMKITGHAGSGRSPSEMFHEDEYAEDDPSGAICCRSSFGSWSCLATAHLSTPFGTPLPIATGFARQMASTRAARWHRFCSLFGMRSRLRRLESQLRAAATDKGQQPSLVIVLAFLDEVVVPVPAALAPDVVGAASATLAENCLELRPDKAQAWSPPPHVRTAWRSSGALKA